MAATVNIKDFPLSDQLSCPQCQHSITLYDRKGCEAVACPQCHSYLLFNDMGRPYVKDKISSLQNKPVIPLGTIGTLQDVEYKVIAYMEKKEGGTRYAWREYMLYNYAKGYAFLAEYDGHWTLIAGTNFYPDLKTVNSIFGNEAQYDGYDYGKFNAYSPEITAMVGEFDWDIFNENIKAKEYIAPPYLLTSEENIRAHVTDWYWGKYLEPAEIAKAFNIPEDKFPEKFGIGANQPSVYRDRWLASVKISGIAAVLFLAVQLLVGYLRPEKVLLAKTYTLTVPPDTSKHNALPVSAADSALTAAAAIENPTTASLNTSSGGSNGNFEMKPFKTESFTIDRGPEALEFELSAQIDNNWVAATTELVSEKDNQTWDVSKDIEYYHGYEDGESWSEGSVNENVLLSEIPPGRYHINIYSYEGSNLPTAFFIRVTGGVTLWRNIIVVLLLLCLYPAYCWYRMRKFEVNRWMNSNFSPYDAD